MVTWTNRKGFVELIVKLLPEKDCWTQVMEQLPNYCKPYPNGDAPLLGPGQAQSIKVLVMRKVYQSPERHEQLSVLGVTAFYNAKDMVSRLLRLKEDKEHVETKVANKVQDIRAQLGMDGERCASSQGKTEVPMHSLPAEEAGNGISELVVTFDEMPMLSSFSTALVFLKRGAQVKRVNWTGYLQLYDFNGNALPYSPTMHHGKPAEILYKAVDGSLQYAPWRSEDFLSNDWIVVKV